VVGLAAAPPLHHERSEGLVREAPCGRIATCVVPECLAEAVNMPVHSEVAGSGSGTSCKSRPLLKKCTPFLCSYTHPQINTWSESVCTLCSKRCAYYPAPLDLSKLSAQLTAVKVVLGE
jgi:hypothetical protein